jgi:dihydrofolate synthase/folylpolyglutamate synthase
VPADTLSRIRARGHIGIRLGLGRMQALLRELGDPQRALHGVLIAGTNGKGSVAAMTASMLAAAGYSTGASPSPHLHSYRERVTVNGAPIAFDALEPLLAEVLRASEPGQAEFGPATEFELMTAAAYLWAAREAVEVMVMEVGLGGRLDASNAWHPEVAAITHVGLDHQEFLGDTIASVAAEKAAIIKSGARAVTGAEGAALEVIREHARQVGAPLDVRSPLAVRAMDRTGITLDDERLGPLRIPLLGRHQAGNAAVALGVIEALAEAGVATVSDDALRRGLATTRWPGRLELVEHQDLAVVIDGAHNPDGMAVLSATIDELAPSLPGGRATLLAGVMRDKEVDDMLSVLASSAVLGRAHLVATAVPETERALPAAELARRWTAGAAATSGATAEAIDDADAALDRALAIAAREGGPLVVAGSLYLVGHLRARLVPGVEVDDDA